MSEQHYQRILKRFTALSLFLFPLLLYATPSAELTAKLNYIRSMQASFTQIVYDNRGKAIQQSKGRMAIERPGKFRWEVKKPLPQLIIANGTRLWIYDPDLQQLTIRSLKQAAGETPALLLTRTNNAIEKEYTITSKPEEASGVKWFELVPKGPDSMFASIQIGFLQDGINKMQLQDHLGHRTFVQFEDIKMNISLAPSLFSITPPRGVDVIDETSQRSS